MKILRNFALPERTVRGQLAGWWRRWARARSVETKKNVNLPLPIQRRVPLRSWALGLRLFHPQVSSLGPSLS